MINFHGVVILSDIFVVTTLHTNFTVAASRVMNIESYIFYTNVITHNIYILYFAD